MSDYFKHVKIWIVLHWHVAFQQAGSLLDASARIYSFRVDATHSEAYDVRSKLGESKFFVTEIIFLTKKRFVIFKNGNFQSFEQTTTKVGRKIVVLAMVMRK